MAPPAQAQNKTKRPAAPPPETQTCIAQASAFHKVNADILRAILKVESAFKSQVVNRNANGTIDVGIAQINTIHFKELAKHSIAPQDLLDPCIGVYVAAWHLDKQLKKHGNTWFGIAAYHSVTPYFNYRYQTLVFNALVDMQVLAGPKLSVPALPASSRPTAISSTSVARAPDPIFSLNAAN